MNRDSSPHRTHRLLPWLTPCAAAGVLVALSLQAFFPAGPWRLVAWGLAAATLVLLLLSLRTRAGLEQRIDDALEQARDRGKTVVSLQHEREQQAKLEADLVQAKQAAESAAMAKGEFLATMSHEIRTPLNGIMPMLDLLLQEPLAPEHKALVQTAYVSSQQMLRIVDDILDYSKLEADRLVLETTTTHLRELLDTVLDLMLRPAEAKGLRLQVQIDSNVRLPVRTDPVRLRQVLTNLVGNAIKFTARGTITVRLRRIGETASSHQVRFEVQDTGIGITPAVRARLFQPFSQADASTTRLYGGTGLGLVICKRIVELMGGRIGVASEPKQGSTFWFEVPLLKIRGDMAPTSAAAATRLLLISADARLRARLDGLLPNWGYPVTAVDTTQEGLERLRTSTLPGKTPYAVVLADLLGMHGSGLALHRNLARLPADSRPALVCLSGDAPVLDELKHTTSVLDRLSPDALLRKMLGQATAPRAVAAAEAAPDSTSNATRAASLRNARVLLVEDNPVNRMVGQRLLEVLGVASETADDGEAALARLSESHYDIVLMDCQMPILDGYGATRRWREHEARQDDGRRLPIVAMTANAMAEDRQKCLDAGMDDYLSKPVSQTQLADCLYRWYRPSAPGAGNTTPTSGVQHEADAAPTAPQDMPAPASPPRSTDAPATPPDLTTDTAAPDGGPPAIDAEIFDELRGLLGSAFAPLLRVFLQDTPTHIATLATAATGPDYPRLYQVAHSLKSSSANLGALHLSTLAKQIEADARRGAMDDPVAAVAQLAEAFERVRVALQAALPDDAA